MKKLVLLLLVLISIGLNAQENYKWNVLIDSIPKSKEKLYTDAKVFVVKTWNSANNVIQIDDKENGHIAVKGLLKQPIMSLGMSIGDVYYSYIVNFYFKENKTKITIDDVRFRDQTIGQIWDTYLGQLPTTEYPGLTKAGLSKKYYEKLYNDIHFELQNIVNLYTVEIKKETKTDNW